ncbi:MAG: DUF3179 domain-containing protein [Pseudomonadota bacterium]
MPPFWDVEWPNTDFQRAAVPFVEILSGGPPKDGIPAIDDPVMVPIAHDMVLPDDEPVVTVKLEGHPARAYPIRYLTWHEIVNDRIGEVPVSVTFCPLCNSHLVFDGRHGDRELTFGVSGKLRNSDMVMYDRQTESWWQQFTGQGIVGDLTGEQLTLIPAWMESWASFKADHADGLVMAQPDRFRRPYGENPYAGYDTLHRPFLYNGEMPPHGIEPLARVVRVKDTAWPLQRIADAGTVTEGGVTITWEAGKASALDGRRISGSRDVGQIRVYDAQTGADVVHEVVFAFAFHAFEPDGTWMLGE